MHYQLHLYLRCCVGTYELIKNVATAKLFIIFKGHFYPFNAFINIIECLLNVGLLCIDLNFCI